MNIQPTAHSLFLSAWDNAPKIPFKTEWKNSTGYLDYATDDDTLKLNTGEFVATLDDYERKVLLKCIGENLYHIVFERFTKGANGILVANSPSGRYLKNLDYSTHGFESSLSVGTTQVFLNLKEPTVLLAKDEEHKILKLINEDTPVSIVSEIIESIQNEVPILLSKIRDAGIDSKSIEFNFLVRQWNL